jgi:hypothetical protein
VTATELIPRDIQQNFNRPSSSAITRIVKKTPSRIENLRHKITQCKPQTFKPTKWRMIYISYSGKLVIIRFLASQRVRPVERITSVLLSSIK